MHTSYEPPVPTLSDQVKCPQTGSTTSCSSHPLISINEIEDTSTGCSRCPCLTHTRRYSDGVNRPCGQLGGREPSLNTSSRMPHRAAGRTCYPACVGVCVYSRMAGTISVHGVDVTALTTPIFFGAEPLASEPDRVRHIAMWASLAYNVVEILSGGPSTYIPGGQLVGSIISLYHLPPVGRFALR